MSVNLYNATTDTLKNVAGDIINPQSVNNTIAPTEETTTASRAYNIGEQFLLNDVLYKATANIVQGDTITVGTNCSASDKLTEQIDDKQDKTDNSLTTTAKTVVGGINEVNSNILTKQAKTDNSLETDDKTVVGAINEVNSNLADISTDGTVKTVIWRDYNIQENIERGLPFDMPEDGYVIVRAGAANNSTTTMLTLVVTIQNSLRVAEVILDSPYSEATLSTPYLKKGTPVLINVIMRANTWTFDTRGTIDFTVI